MKKREYSKPKTECMEFFTEGVIASTTNSGGSGSTDTSSIRKSAPAQITRTDTHPWSKYSNQ